MDSSLVAIIVAVGVVCYAIWAIHRLYIVFGKCPRCRRRLNRTADVCGACGCRPHEYKADRKGARRASRHPALG